MSKFCPECGLSVTPGQKFCAGCGMKVVSAQPVPDTPAAQYQAEQPPVPAPVPAPAPVSIPAFQPPPDFDIQNMVVYLKVA